MSGPKNCVLLVTTPADWHPDRVHSVPPSIGTATVYAKNLSLSKAVAVAKAHNLAHLQKGTYQGQWAIVGYSLKRQPRWQPAAADDQQQPVVKYDWDDATNSYVRRDDTADSSADSKGGGN